MGKKEKFKINFEVGDWSGDGHGMSEKFLVQSDCPVEQVRDVHFSCLEDYGFDIGDICGEYEECTIKENIIQIIEGMGISVFPIIKDEDFLSPEDVVDLWIAILNKIDPALKLERIDEDVPSMHFFGFDEKKRHLNNPGYGCFGS